MGSAQPNIVGPVIVSEDYFANTPIQNLAVDEGVDPLGENPGRNSIIRNEILTLTRVLDRLPPSSLQNEGTEWDHLIPLAIAEDPVGGQGSTSHAFNPNVLTEMPVAPSFTSAGSPMTRGKKTKTQTLNKN